MGIPKPLIKIQAYANPFRNFHKIIYHFPDMKTLQLLLFFLCSAAFAEAQTPEQYLNAMKDTLTGVETFQYKALMRTKRMGGDQFKDRHFEVYAKWNPQYSGINYPFDWQIIERKKGYDLIFFFINNDFFSVVNSEKFVVHDQNVYHLDKHSFFEYMRWLVFFDELSGAPAGTYTGSSMKFDDNYTTEELLAINIKTFETVDRVLCLNKK
ncbi:MAG: hypothetical protein HUU01_23880, partial [Saprospiraceae bacterium]|nr:hypothetical protein [Saprospiraceae bacterium]